MGLTSASKSSYSKQKGVESRWPEPRAWSLQASVFFTYIDGLFREPEHSHPSKVFLRLPECRLGTINLSVFCNPRTRHHFPDITEWNLLAVELHTPTCTKLTSKYSRDLFQVFGIRGKLWLAFDRRIICITVMWHNHSCVFLAGGISISGADDFFLIKVDMFRIEMME